MMLLLEPAINAIVKYVLLEEIKFKPKIGIAISYSRD